MIEVLLWLKALHFVAFAAWMAGLWYLPRLLVYHSDTAPGDPGSETFKLMEQRLLRVIATPAMVATFVFGFGLMAVSQAWTAGWLHAKIVLLLGLGACHGLLVRHVRAFAADQRPRSGRYFRIFNEVPTLLFVGIVLLAVFRPF